MGKMLKPRWGRKFGYVIWGAAGLALLAVLVWLAVGRLDFDDPTVTLKTPVEVVGAKTALTIEAGDLSSGLKEVKVTFSQGDQSKVVAERTFPPGGDRGEPVEIPVTLEPQALGFKEGKATLTVEARDRSWRNLFRGRTASLKQEVVIDLVPVNLAFQATSHLLHAGGTGTICYRLNKEVKESGVLVGNRFYRGFPNPKGTKGEYVVLFPVPQEGPAAFRVELVARPSLGNEVKQAVSLHAKPRRWRHDSINLSDELSPQGGNKPSGAQSQRPPGVLSGGQPEPAARSITNYSRKSQPKATPNPCGPGLSGGFSASPWPASGTGAPTCTRTKPWISRPTWVRIWPPW